MTNSTRRSALAEKGIAPHAADIVGMIASGFNAVHIPEEYDGLGADSVGSPT
jgi:hypothetical protein